MHSPRILASAMLALAPIALATTASSAAAAAAAVPGATPYPRPAVCVDQPGVLGADTCARVTQVLRADQRASTDEIAVVVVHSTGAVPIETWGTGLFNTWGVGSRTSNNGVLLVVATDDRRLRIVTGSGLTDRLPDGAASEIINGTITPLFTDGRIRDGVLAGLDEIRRRLGHDVTDDNQLANPTMAPIPAVTDTPSHSSSGWVGLVMAALGLGIFGYALYRSHQASKSGLRGWGSWHTSGSSGSGSSGSRSSGSSGSRSSGFRSSGSGSSGSGSSGFGGGSSSGGGASGSW